MVEVSYVQGVQGRLKQPQARFLWKGLQGGRGEHHAMCGIAGFVDFGTMDGLDRLATLGQMCQAILHRGPDDQGTVLRGPAALGMRRLSIIDVGGGRQPIFNEDGRIAVVFNGEIYNHLELRHELESRGHRFQTQSDTEVIVHGYEEYGLDCVTRLRGMFGFAIWDSRDETLLLARDRVGKKPLHYAQLNDALVFGSEIKSILQHPSIRREVNYDALSSFLSFGYVPDPLTAFHGISKLPPGHILTLRNGVVQVKPYWDFPSYSSDQTVPMRSEESYVTDLRMHLEDAVKVRLISEVPLGAFLSGGIDSSTVVGLMTKLTGRPVKTFSIGFSEGSHDELVHARITARHFESDHHEFVVTPDICGLVREIVWHHDEPFGDSSSIPTYMVSKMAREHVTVVLSGDGGDEVFGGYTRYLTDQRRAYFDRMPSVLKRTVLRPLVERMPRSWYGRNFLYNMSLDEAGRYLHSLNLFSADAKQGILSQYGHTLLNGYRPDMLFRRLFNSPNSPERLEHLLYLDSKTYLPGDILAKVDRMSMAHSIEARSPLLDHKLIEYAGTLPSAFKLHHGVTKYILKQAVEGLIPAEIIHRPKHGFSVPLEKWLRKELQPMLHDLLLDRTARARGLLDQAGVSEVMAEHQRGRRDHSQQLWALLSLEVWFRMFIDRAPDLAFDGAKEAALSGA